MSKHDNFLCNLPIPSLSELRVKMIHKFSWTNHMNIMDKSARQRLQEIIPQSLFTKCKVCQDCVGTLVAGWLQLYLHSRNLTPQDKAFIPPTFLTRSIAVHGVAIMHKSTNCIVLIRLCCSDIIQQVRQADKHQVED